MRSAMVVAAFVAGAIAIPYQKRDVVTDVDMTYVTEVVTVTAGEAMPTSTSEEALTTAHQAAHFGHHSWHAESSSTEVAPVVTVIVTPSSSTSEYVAPTTSSTSIVYVMPTTSSTSEYVAPSTSSTSIVSVTPTTSSTSEYVAPTTSSTSMAYVAPTTSSTSEYVAPTTAPAVVIPILSTASSTMESSSVPTSYSEITVYHHNIHRANHSAPDIEWDEGLAITAALIASSCVYAHNTDANGGGYGQNIAAGVEPANISAIITDLFYNGEVGWFDGYGAANPDMTNFEHWGHFSQIVWKASTHVGCATQYCPSGLGNVGSGVSPYFTVCNYQEVGNMGGEYGQNIGESLGHATADWSAGGVS